MPAILVNTMLRVLQELHTRMLPYRMGSLCAHSTACSELTAWFSCSLQTLVKANGLSDYIKVVHGQIEEVSLSEW